MVRGFYSAAAGMLSRQRSFDVAASNLANLTTTGYKAQATVESSFGQHLVVRIDDGPAPAAPMGPGTFMTVNDETYTDFSQGPIKETGRTVDVALQGAGYFLIDSQRYGQVLTRQGEFALDERLQLVLPGVGRVLGSGRQAIQLKSADFSVDSQGRLFEEGKQTGQIGLFLPDQEAAMTKVGEGLFTWTGGIQAAGNQGASFLQGCLERSNVDLAREMSRMIAGQAHFQSCSQVLKVYDRINELGVNRIGSID